MKILLVSPIPPPNGGIASWTKRYLSSKIANEHEIILINTAVKGNRIKNLNKKSILEEIKRNIDLIKQVKKISKKNKIGLDIAHINTPCSKTGIIRDYIFTRILKRNNIKVLIHFRCDVPYMINNKISKKILEKIVSKADILITLNKKSQEYIQENFGINSKILPNFLPEEYIKIAYEKRKINDEIKSIVYTGHVTKAKGCDVILKIAKEYPKKKFELIGYISDDFKNINIPQNVTLRGEVTVAEVKDFLNSADLFLFPSHTEGFPNSVAEAMAFGVPILSTPVGAIPDMIEEKGGILANIDDVDKFKKSIEFLENKEKRKKMSEWNKNKVINNYDINIVLRKLIAIYREEK